MPKKNFNNVRHLTTTIGQGALTLGGVPVGWQSFAAAGALAGDEPTYELREGDAWELGYLTLGAGVTTATRQVLQSTNNNQPLNLQGAAVITCSPLAETTNRVAYLDSIARFTSSADAANASDATASLSTAGGAAIAKAAHVGGRCSVASTAASTSTTTGALTVSGGAGIAGALFAGGELHGGVGLFLKNTAGIDVRAVEATRFGYSSAYQVVRLGGGTSVTLALGVDPATNPGGNFQGNGCEILLPSDVRLVQANSASTDWLSPTIAFQNGFARVGSLTTAAYHSEQFSVTARANMEGIGVKTVTSGFAAVDLQANDLLAYFRNASGVGVGSISYSGSTTTYATSSDKGLKEDAQDPLPRAYAVLMGTKLWDFRWRSSGKRGIGVFAQDEAVLFPEAIVAPHREGDHWSADYSQYVAPTMAVVQDLIRRVSDLEAHTTA